MTKAVSVRGVMTPSPLVVQADQTLPEAQEIMRSNKIRHLPVCFDGRVLGIISERDLYVAAALAPNAPSLKLVDFYSPEPYVIDVDDEFDKVLAYMAEHRIDSAVVNENGEVVGIITTTDICSAFGELVSELKRLLS